MANVLLTWELGGGLGHLVPLRDIARELLRLGHNVSLAARDLTNVPRVFENLAVDVFQAPLNHGHCRISNDPASTFAHVLYNTGCGDPDSVHVLCRAWESVYAAAKPDFVLFDHSPMAMLGARGHNFRRATIGSGFWLPTGQGPMPIWRTWADVDPAKMLADEETTLARVNSGLSRLGKVPLRSLGDLYCEVDQVFAITYPELDLFPNRNPADYFGAWSSDVTPSEQLSKANSGEHFQPLIFAYLKQFPALDQLLKSLGDLGIPSLIYSPTAVNSDAWRCFKSATLRIVNEPVNVREILNDCRLVICNGGYGLILQSLLAGKPVLSFPLTLDQRLHAEKVQCLGAGIACDPRVKVGISERILQILRRDSYTKSADVFRQTYCRKMDAPSNLDRVIKRIVELL